ncbi:cytochrome P450 [Coprinellus micaceus]|uniref:Cytochrome P450 n=1 Tax=Coprinellus micaceus TaxID=71717 RepID=A0A4Y7T5G5_COPMI|nr:cytochrome P450 [Coprinellus micaceus]
MLHRHFIPVHFPFRTTAHIRDLPGPPPRSLLTGNLAQLFSPKGLPFHLRLGEVYGGVVRVWGFFPVYVSDPRAISVILGKEGECFDETGVFLECNKIIFGPGLVSTTGELHKRQRKLALPMFSTRQLGRAEGVFGEVGEKVYRSRDEDTNEPTEGILDMSEWTSRGSLEAAGRAILGYSFDPLDSRVANRYTSAIKELIPTLFSLALVRNFAPFLVKLGPPAFRRWVVERIPSRRVRKVMESSDVMHESARGILDERRAALLSSSRSSSNTTTIRGNTNSDHNSADEDSASEPKDIITTLLHTNSLCAEGDRMSDAELTGQMTVLIFGAQDTTAGALARVFWRLSRDGEVQRRVREEIKRAWEEGRSHHLVTNNDNNEDDGKEEKRLDVDAIMGLPETLRVYPPVPFVRRVCTKATAIPYTPSIPSLYPSPTPPTPPASPSATSVSPTTTAATPGDSTGTRDKKGRGTARKPYSDHVKIPGAWNGMLTFLGGGRSCVGSRFAIIEMKIILATVLSKMYFKPTGDEIAWNLSQIISPSVVRRLTEEKGLPLVAVLDDLTV